VRFCSDATGNRNSSRANEAQTLADSQPGKNRSSGIGSANSYAIEDTMNVTLASKTLTAASTPSPVKPAPQSRAQTAKARLLVADDEIGPRESVRVVFRDEYEVAAASCGAEAIAYVRQNPVDIAVLDIRMPDLTGIDVLKALKQIDPNIEVIMLTAYETLDTARDAIRYGASDYLNKPFDVRAMRETVARCLENRRKKMAALLELADLQKKTEQLQREVVNNNRALTAGVLSSGVIHDVNNPISIIMIKTEMLIEKIRRVQGCDPTTVADLTKDLELINRETERCRSITRRFLDLSRRKEDAAQSLNANNLVADVLALLKAHPAAADKELLKNVPAEPLTIHGNQSELFQILVNLGVNALQAMKSGGKLTLCVRACAAPLRDLENLSNPPAVVHRAPQLNVNQPFVEIAVHDTGSGIPQEVLPRILEPYFTTKPKGEGTGLGLAICAQLLDHYHGALKISSVAGKGTTCAVYLPQQK
jgi:signal transduction histidine kinase